MASDRGNGDGDMKSGSGKRRKTGSAASGRTIDLSRLTAVLEDFGQIEYAFVFGSARDGVIGADSDLDLAVWLAQGETVTIEHMAEIVGRIEDAFAVTCDLTVLNAAGPVLAHEALKGRVLFIRPGCREDFSEFYVRTCAEFEDLMAWRKRQLAYRGYECPSTVS